MSLSDKRLKNSPHYHTDDVREFIKDVKIKIVENDTYTADEIFRVIDQEAGKKLI